MFDKSYSFITIKVTIFKLCSVKKNNDAIFIMQVFYAFSILSKYLHLKLLLINLLSFVRNRINIIIHKIFLKYCHKFKYFHLE